MSRLVASLKKKSPREAVAIFNDLLHPASSYRSRRPGAISLPNIPIPARVWWREFRVRGLPLLVFLLVLAAVVALWRTHTRQFVVVTPLETDRSAVFTSQTNLTQPVEAGASAGN